MMVHFGRDAALAATLADSDPFTLLAAQWRSKPRQDVTSRERAWAKALAYGMLYGKGPNAVAVDLGVPVHEAVSLMDGFRASTPGVTAWLHSVVEEARSRAPAPHVLTLAGRRRDLPGLTAAGGPDARDARHAAERRAVNTVCQGSAADVLKTALVALQRRLATDPQRRARLVLSVHDDVVLQVAPKDLAWAAGTVRATLVASGERAGLSVPLEVQLRAGPDWDALRALD